MSGSTCAGCGRSVWSCDLEGGEDCRAHASGACTALSHEQSKSARPSRLKFRGVQEDGEGGVALVYLDCPKCSSTLAVSPEQWIRSAVHPPRLEVVRGEKKTVEIPNETIAELAAEAWRRLES